jgi:hypothetical protein
MEILAFASFAALVVAWLVAPKTGILIAGESEGVRWAGAGAPEREAPPAQRTEAREAA